MLVSIGNVRQAYWWKISMAGPSKLVSMWAINYFYVVCCLRSRLNSHSFVRLNFCSFLIFVCWNKKAEEHGMSCNDFFKEFDDQPRIHTRSVTGEYTFGKGNHGGATCLRQTSSNQHFCLFYIFVPIFQDLVKHFQCWQLDHSTTMCLIIANDVTQSLGVKVRNSPLLKGTWISHLYRAHLTFPWIPMTAVAQKLHFKAGGQYLKALNCVALCIIYLPAKSPVSTQTAVTPHI